MGQYTHADMLMTAEEGRRLVEVQDKVRMLGALVLCSLSEHVFYRVLV